MSTGNTAPYHFIQPSTDYDVQIVSSTATMASVTCSLNVTIPSSVLVLWRYNGSIVSTTSPNNVTKTGNIATLLIGNFQPSDAGVYQCVLNNPTIGWVLRRNIRLFITGMFVQMVLAIIICINYYYLLDNFF